MSVSPAATPSGNGKVLVFDEVLAKWNGEEHAEQSRRRQPDERLHARQANVEPARRVGAHDVERGEQPAQKRDLPRRRPGRLDDVVLPAVVVAREQPEREETEERRDDRDVRSEAELEHDVRIRRADDQRDDQSDDDRARRELANVRRFLLSRSGHVSARRRDLVDESANKCGDNSGAGPLAPGSARTAAEHPLARGAFFRRCTRASPS